MNVMSLAREAPSRLRRIADELQQAVAEARDAFPDLDAVADASDHDRQALERALAQQLDDVAWLRQAADALETVLR